MKSFYTFLMLSFLMLTTNLFGQNKTIKIVDAYTNKPIASAHICIENTKSGHKQYSTSNNNGFADVDFTEKKSTIAVTYIGYKNYQKVLNSTNLYVVELEPDVFMLNQIVLTGQDKPMLKDSSIYNINILNSDLINERASVNLGDALTAQPSIKIKQNSQFGSNINILGLGGENVKIMVDGVPVIGRLNGNLDLSQISMNNVDHIEIIEGPMSVIYGSNALAGTINIITKNNKYSNYEVKSTLYVETPGTINADLFGSAKSGKNIYSFSGGRNYFTGTEVPNSRESKWKGKEQYLGDLRYMRKGDNYNFKLETKYFNELMKEKGEVLNPFNPYADDINFLTKRYSANGFLDINHTDKMSTNVQTSASYYNRMMQTMYKDLTSLEEKIISTDTSSFINFMARATFNHSLKDGISYQTGIDIVTETGKTQRITNGEKQTNDYAVFITGKHEFWKNIYIQPGLRYTYNTNFTVPLLYSVNIKTDFNKNFTSRFSVAKGFRAPTLKEMYLNFAVASINIIGNPNLNPETSYSTNASVAYKFNSNEKLFVKTELKGYYNNIKNKIDYAIVDRIDKTDIWQNVNRNSVETIGWIADVAINLNINWNANLNVARSGITSLEYENGLSNKKFLYTNRYTTSVAYKLPEHSFSTRIEYAYNGQEAINEMDKNNKKQIRVGSYNDFNFSFSKSFFKQKLKLTSGVKNIFDNTDIDYIGQMPDNQDNFTMLSWGRSYFVKLNLKLNNY
ncbi:MAG: TonB-dependent receptor [Ichthyobacteriaceae bacterium]|nr:TonB-dependent receptor [Ichthyobacteriaceae bacterium]